MKTHGGYCCCQGKHPSEREVTELSHSPAKQAHTGSDKAQECLLSISSWGLQRTPTSLFCLSYFIPLELEVIPVGTLIQHKETFFVGNFQFNFCLWGQIRKIGGIKLSERQGNTVLYLAHFQLHCKRKKSYHKDSGIPISSFPQLDSYSR